MNTKRLENVLNDFSEWMKANTLDDFFDGDFEGVTHEESGDNTYEVTIKGLDYADAQNVMDFGFEYGKSVAVRIEEGDEQNGNN